MDNVLEISGLSKKYEGFALDNVSLTLPKGNIMGFIGENGAGKSTTIKLILDVIRRDSGKIKIFGQDNIKFGREIKENLGVVYDESNFPDTLSPLNINLIMQNIYKNWDEVKFSDYLAKFALPERKNIGSFSRGMKMKLSLAVALSHNAKLLILDEPTSGLDPIVRDELLDIFLDFVRDKDNSIFLSTHITGDIEKIADCVAFIHQGKIVFVETLDKLINTYGILKCDLAEFQQLDKTYIKSYRKNKFFVEPNRKRQI